MAAIHLLQELEFEGLQASPEQQEILSRYVGWGGLADAFDESKDNWKAEFAELYATLSPEEYAAARASTLNAHYTSPTVIRAIYDAVENMGFQTGNILEPSMGVGNFFGMLPESMKSSRLYGVELDSITGRIAKQLYPKADITVAGFETTDRKDFFDLAVGNVPFGQYQVSDRAFDKLGFSIHNYFFAKALDQVRPGGVVAFVTSRYTMDAKDSAARKYIAQRADFLGAIRLPNNAFKANAGTDVVSDIIFLQKRDRPIEIEPDWVHTGIWRNPGANADGFAINQYFIDHPEMVLGRQTSESTQYGRQDFTVAPIEGADLAEQLSGAIRNIRGTYAEAELPDLGEDETIVETVPADPNVRNFSYTVVDGELYYRQNSIMTKPDFNATAKERAKGMVELRDCVQKLISEQMDGFISDETIRQTQAELNNLYDGFTAKYGLINSRANALAFAEDSSYYRKSYKQKKTLRKDPSEWQVFEGTHEAIIDKETFAIVQRIRDGRRRLTPMGEMPILSGMVFCADCGSKMYQVRMRGWEHDKEYFVCANYRKKTKAACTSHQIRNVVIEQLLLEDLRRVTAFAKSHEEEFVRLVTDSASRSLNREMKDNRKEYEQSQARIAALDKIIQRLYEDNVTGRISDERFARMSATYEVEQQTLEKRVAELQILMDGAKQKAMNVEYFLSLVRKYTDIHELTGEIIREFVEKIIVFKAEKVDGHRQQRIQIIYNAIGAVEIPNEKEAA